jgi:anti-sigma factor RsiW
MEEARGHLPFRACAEARLRASLALDGELDEVGGLRLCRHLEGCSDCVRVIAGMESASRALRRAPLERFRCEILPGQLVRARSSGHGRHLAGAAVAVAALVLATGALPGRDDTAAPSPPGASATAVVVPLELPIGQRSAMDDFAASAADSQRGS